jgi:hypothetical protein
MKKLLCFLALLTVIQTSWSAIDHYARLPKDGVIPDEATAVAVAMVIFKPIFPQRSAVDKSAISI